MAGKRPHAVYCSRTCKTRASDRRRIEDGRSVARDRARYPREREARISYALEYARRNPERGQLAKRKRRALKLAADLAYISPRDWARLLARYGHRCAYCGTDGPLHMDHVVPLSRGGRHAIGNALPACAACNCSKGGKLLAEWRRDGSRYNAA